MLNLWPFKYMPSYDHLCVCLHHKIAHPKGNFCPNVMCKAFDARAHETKESPSLDHP